MVVSSAIPADNPELVAAREARIPVVRRAEMLAELMRFRQGIAVAGTHGKTTTTSLVASVLAEGGLDPTFVIGGQLNSAGSNARLGAGRYLVAEADESDASFLHLQPVIAIVTNIDNDHLVMYGGDFARLRQSFVEFLHNLPFWGLAVLCTDDPVVRGLLPEVGRPVTAYGLDAEADLRAVAVEPHGGQTRFQVLRPGRPALPVTLNLPGLHNVRNALAAIAVATELAVADTAIQQALQSFQGIGRRLEQLGDVRTPAGLVTLVDDYGHHPTEIEATLAAARRAGGPSPGYSCSSRTATRAPTTCRDFGRVLAAADALVVTEVYAAGEARSRDADGRAICRGSRPRRIEPVFVEDPGDIAATLAGLVRDGDVVLTMGAGSIGAVAQELPAPGGGSSSMNRRVAPAAFADRVRHAEPMSRHTSVRRWPAELVRAARCRRSRGIPARAVARSRSPGWPRQQPAGARRRHPGRSDLGARHLDGLERSASCGCDAEAVACARLGRRCVQWQLRPAEFFAGIPHGRGCTGDECRGTGWRDWPLVAEVEVINRAGERRRRAASEYHWGYRRVTPPVPDEWFLAATFGLEQRPDADLATINALLERRRQTQPINERTCGSVFRNPPGDHAARLIEAAGLKGCRIGGAVVSIRHANFIVNEGTATAADLEALLRHVQAVVQDVHGVRLEPEVRILGEAA